MHMMSRVFLQHTWTNVSHTGLKRHSTDQGSVKRPGGKKRKPSWNLMKIKFHDADKTCSYRNDNVVNSLNSSTVAGRLLPTAECSTLWRSVWRRAAEANGATLYCRPATVEADKLQKRKRKRKTHSAKLTLQTQNCGWNVLISLQTKMGCGLITLIKKKKKKKKKGEIEERETYLTVQCYQKLLLRQNKLHWNNETDQQPSDMKATKGGRGAEPLDPPATR